MMLCGMAVTECVSNITTLGEMVELHSSTQSIGKYIKITLKFNKICFR